MTQLVFTDGPALDGRVGAATVLVRPHKSTRSHHLCLGSEGDSERTVHKAELVGTLLGMYPIETEKRDWKVDIAITQRARHIPE